MVEYYELRIKRATFFSGNWIEMWNNKDASKLQSVWMSSECSENTYFMF